MAKGDLLYKLTFQKIRKGLQLSAVRIEYQLVTTCGENMSVICGLALQPAAFGPNWRDNQPVAIGYLPVFVEFIQIRSKFSPLLKVQFTSFRS